MKHLYADGAYDRLTLMDKAAYLRFVLEIIRRSEQQKGFQVLPRRWVVERTLMRMLTDRGSEYCGNPERHEYELCLAIEDVDYTRTKTKSPQTNGICERFHKTALNEFYRVAFRKKVYRSLAELQADLDAWIAGYNEARPHQGRWCFGKTPMQTFLDALPMTREKTIAA